MSFLFKQRLFFSMVLFCMGALALHPERGSSVIVVDPSMVDQIRQIIQEAKPGEKIRFVKGTYLLKDGIRIWNKSYLHLLAEPGVYFILNDMRSSVISISKSDHITLSRFHARHRDPVKPGEVCDGSVITVYSSHEIDLFDLELNGSGTIGVAITNSISIFVKNSHIHDNTVAGVSMQRFFDHIVLENNRFDHNPVHILSPGLSREKWDTFITLKNNRFDQKPGE